MAIERETVVERPVERETVVTGGSPFGAIGAIIAVILLVVLALWLFGGVFNGGESVSVDLPTVTVDP
ncbi:hypothetical protein EMQ25_09470 [Arsenicitalea aurantiaca]|uniref:Uncharacterized protein n=1 Tax=Arsenicitalea aurantiaca TaxID=1783274 RepID=A0A433XAJ9_9HYPH|nr:hypothetical protein [Arsenicitalea aurantiaca]RUT31095.1 hypothetical protein EMQ25_09470 [Arsenicitalea aurantiaca]